MIHDDVQFYQNVPEVFLNTFSQNPELMIVGELGQCWRCHFAPFCKPQKVLQGEKPSAWWPYTPDHKIDNPADYDPKQGFQYACRINEWCCMINVNYTKQEKSCQSVFNQDFIVFREQFSYLLVKALKALFSCCYFHTVTPPYSPACEIPRISSSFSVSPMPRSISLLPRSESMELSPIPPSISLIS